MLLATLGDDPAVVARSHVALSESLRCEKLALLPVGRWSSRGRGEEEETLDGQARVHVLLPANGRRASALPAHLSSGPRLPTGHRAEAL